MAKPALSIGDQIDLLVQRGLPVPLPADADFHERESEYRAVVRLLIDNNYYRLSGYWRYFQVNPGRGDNRFTAAGTVAQIETVYTFDHDLRSILLEGLAALEVTFRSRFAYYVAVNLPGDCYVDRTSFINRRGQNGRQLRDVLIADIEQELARSKERFVAHHRAKGQTVPIWAAVEVLSFGTISKMYGLFADQTVRRSVSKSFGLPNPIFAASLIKSFVVLRNICAHHARLWNRVPDVPPPVLNKFKDAEPHLYRTTSPWAWFVMVAHLVDAIRRDSAFSTRLWAHIASRPALCDGYRYPRHS